MSYYQLTPDVIIDALSSIGIHVDTGLMALNSYENRVYRFNSDADGPLVVKFYRPERWTLAQIQEEHKFLFALAAAKVRVATPVQREQSSVFVWQDIPFAVWPAVRGRSFETDNLDQLTALGEQLARLHQVGEHFTLNARPTLSAEQVLTHAQQVLEQEAIMPNKLRNEFFSQLSALNSKASQLYQPQQQLTIHGDCHGSNILWQDGVWLVDFDDCRQGPAVQDLWMMLSGTRQEQLLQLDALLSGYEEVREFNNTELALIEPLRAIRMVNYMAWLATRWSDPAFPANFPWFNTEDYWLQQTKVLAEQRQALDTAPLSLTSWY